MRTLVAGAVVCVAALCQATNTGSGVMAQWDVSTMLNNLDAKTKQLGALVDQMRPDMWATNGAPAGYTVQLKTGKDEVQYLIGSADALSQEPERLTLALDTLFRLQALDRTLGSLVQATRKYQNPSLADTLQARLGEASVLRDRLRLYVVELAKQKEHEYQVMDSEAQRCRGTLAAGSRSGTAQRRRTAPSNPEQK